ncbi:MULTISPECIES: DUF3156 family protein [Pseudomonas]|uniref:DUF3156 family protein n=1 Tax=Pseudomonas fluorescens TaxID=294 RepID=A0A5E6W9K1_PSEFL|nr:MULTISPECIES: DUF3156 family protein [Pseudomonas]VVN25343.1 hypothetical protein PS652_04546 [Pseudomonas fluorescens]
MAIALRQLWQRLSERAPAGYRPGLTLERVQHNLGLDSFEVLGPGLGRFAWAGQAVQVRERCEAQLLMHLVLTEFSLTLPATGQGNARLELHHSGSLRRSDLRVQLRKGEPALQAELQRRLQADGPLLQALMPLDFKRLLLHRCAGQWTLTLEHVGASEVVNRLPAFRRYIRLSPEQRQHLLVALQGLPALLAGL